MEAKIEHLKMIQAVITRMANNLFFLKGWSITLVAALFALGAKDANLLFMVIAYLPVFIFWILDGYFLAHERRYRDLYNEVRALKPEEINFSMDAEKFKNKPKNTWIAAICSKTLVWFYLPMVLVMLFVIIKLVHN